MHHLGDFKDFLDEDIMQVPDIGSITSLIGECLEKEECLSGKATLFLRNEPRGASNYCHKMKIVIKWKETNVKLQRNQVETHFNAINPGMKVAVKGRVEKLTDDELVDEPNRNLIKFKVVIDSDSHALGYMQPKLCVSEKKINLSKSWWSEQTGDKSWKIKVGDCINKTSQRAFLESTAKDDDILDNVVGLRNSFDGDIFIGVKENGEITGMKSEKNKMDERVGKLSKAITQILPEFKEGAARICFEFDDVDEEECFIFAMKLCSPGERKTGSKLHDYIIWIHVLRGKTAPFYYRSDKNVHAYMRKGSETKRIKNHEEFFNLLRCLANHSIPKQIPEEELNVEYKIKEANLEIGLQKCYKVLQLIEK